MKEFEMTKIGKTALAMVLAGTFAFSPVLASANTLSGQDDKVAEKIITAEDAENVQVSDDAEKPSLVPGDFFYFVKIALEKIKLAITFDNEKEAELLASYAAERLAEAEELFNAGEEDRAIETIKSAIAYINDYDKKAEEEVSKEEPKVDDESGQPSSDEEKSDDQEQADDEVTDEQQPADEEAAVEEDEDAAGSEQVVRQNIIALKAAMEKVKNPTAKAMLQKNIDKTYKKMAEKLGKIDGMEPEEEDKDQVAVEEETEVTEPAAPVETEEQPKADEEEKQEQAVIVPAAPKKQQVEKEAKKAAIEVRKQEQQKVIAEKKEQKQAAKEVRKTEKKEVKQAKQAQQAAKKENKPKGNSGQNGNKNGNNPHNKQ